MENIKEILAKNLVELRKSRKYTQQELAEKLNYSDKAISRWEHAETLPDIETLCRVCDIYGVKFEYLLQKEQPKKNPYVRRNDLPNKIIIMLVAIAAVWLAITVSYSYINLILNENRWTLFIWAIPLTCFIALVCNRFFFQNRIFKYTLQSLICWTLILSIYVELLATFNAWLLFIIGIPIQVLIILLAILKMRK